MKFPNKKQVKKLETVLVNIQGSVSKHMAEQLNKISDEKRVPKSVLIARAIANELDSQTPFEFDVSMPDIAYVDEDVPGCVQLHKFIQSHPGLSIEHLVILKEDIGINNKETLLLAYRRLLAVNMIEEYYPQSPQFLYPRSTYRVVRINKNPAENDPTFNLIRETITKGVLP